METNTTQPQAGLVVRDGFQGAEMHALAELSSRAVAEQARAAVESRYIMALKRPRDIDLVRARLLKECRRPTFAETAIYSKPVGGASVTGFSIRFAEAAIRTFGNVYASTETIYDDDTKRIIRITVTDLEANVTYPKDVTIAKQVERRDAGGRRVIGTRMNSQGKRVHIVEATEDELLTKEAALASKALRQNGLRLIPGDILDECRELLEKTASEGSKDPDIARKKIVDSYGFFNIGPDQLAAYLGHPMAQATPDELRELTTLYNALREGDVTWREALEQRKGEREPASEELELPKKSAAANLVQQLKERGVPSSAVLARSFPVQPLPEEAEEPKANSPEDVGFAQPAPGEDPAITELKQKIAAKRAAFDLLVGDKKLADTRWKNGVKTLRGATSITALRERLQQAEELVYATKDELRAAQE